MKEIPLSKTGKNKGKYVALVDDSLFEEVNKYDWHYDTGYASNSKMKIKLHRYIWTLKYGEIPNNKEVEHIDRNKLNCQISNLRLATRSENSCNKTKYKNNKSGFKGVSKVVYKNQRKDKIYTYEKWHAYITKDGKTYQKDFDYNDDGFESAKKWIEQKSLELHKEFSIYSKDK